MRQLLKMHSFSLNGSAVCEKIGLNRSKRIFRLCSFLCPFQISFVPNYSNFALAAIREAPQEATLSAEYVSCAEKQWRGKIISFIQNWLGERCTQDRRSNTLLNAASYDLCSIILEIDYSSWECFWKYFLLVFLYLLLLP